MRFWQAVVTAQLAAGSVYADRYAGDIPVQILAEAGTVVIGAVLWRVFKAVLGAPDGRAS